MPTAPSTCVTCDRPLRLVKAGLLETPRLLKSLIPAKPSTFCNEALLLISSPSILVRFDKPSTSLNIVLSFKENIPETLVSEENPSRLDRRLFISIVRPLLKHVVPIDVTFD